LAWIVDHSHRGRMGLCSLHFALNWFCVIVLLQCVASYDGPCDDLHWLPIRQRILYKLSTIVYKSVFMRQLHPIWRIYVFQSLPILVVVIFAQQHMETCRCLERERWLMDHEVLLFQVLLSGTLCHRPYMYRPLHANSFRVD